MKILISVKRKTIIVIIIIKIKIIKIKITIIITIVDNKLDLLILLYHIYLLNELVLRALPFFSTLILINITDYITYTYISIIITIN